MRNYDQDLDIKTKRCTECGRVCSILDTKLYKYKVTIPGRGLGYQCSFTCYDHALLRNEGPKKYLSKEKYRKEVESCERIMKGQGKEIKSPIIVR